MLKQEIKDDNEHTGVSILSPPFNSAKKFSPGFGLPIIIVISNWIFSFSLLSCFIDLQEFTIWSNETSTVNSCFYFASVNPT